MKKLYFFLAFSLFLIIMPMQSYAFEHGYERKTEAVYATVRYELAVYSDIGGDFVTYLSTFKGIKAWKESSNWYRIEYKKSGDTKTGYITAGDLESDCLIYDGREKQILANGEYQMTYVSKTSIDQQRPDFEIKTSLNNSFHLTFTFLGDGLFTIMNTQTGQYMQPDPMFNTGSRNFWGSEETAGAFLVTRKGNTFSIQDNTSKRYLTKTSAGAVCFTQNDTSCWKIRRYDKAISDDSIRVFAQFDADWAGHYYGPGTNDDPSTNVFTTSACGIFSTVNAIYALTGMYPNPYELADYAVKKHYRILDSGTDNGFFKAAASEFGEKYGFTYDGSSGSIEELKEKLAEGDVAINHVPGHYTAVVSYSEKKDKFLLLDPHYLPKRATNAYGDWIERSDLESGNLQALEFFFFKPDRPKDE